MYRIAKQFKFSASHQLGYLPDGHKCARLHGHNYRIEVEIMGTEVDANGFLVDFGEMGKFKDLLDRAYDHRHLNEVLSSPDGRETTAENLASNFFAQARQYWPGVSKVTVWETPDCWASYTGRTGA